MKQRPLVLASALVAIVITAVLYNPVSGIIYKIREPCFKSPIRYESKSALNIRNDQVGDGDFGAKRRNGRSHSGIDILASVGTPVYASKSGIAFRGNVPTGYGKYVMIYHPDGYQTIYGHLSGWCVYSTQRVHRGEVIGLVGKTGNASGKAVEPHLHFEILKDGVPQNPKELMR